jgi:hypothetical protein
MLLSILLLSFYFISVYSIGGGGGGNEFDVSWDFDGLNEYSGWANASTEEMQMETMVENGELRGSIIGSNPNIDSPPLFMEVGGSHYVVIRMMYYGGATNGVLLLRSGSKSPDRGHLDHGKAYWTGRQHLTTLSSSPAVSPEFSMTMTTDDNPYTYFLSSSPAGVYIIFDLHDVRTITSLTIKTTGDENSPKRCLLQQSRTSGVGPFETVSIFTLEKTTSVTTTNFNITNTTNGMDREILEQTISQFSGQARFWRLLVIDNYGGPGVGIREFKLDGYNEEIAVVPFDVDNSGKYHNYYIPIFQHFQGNLLRMRLEFIHKKKEQITKQKEKRQYREALSIDFIRIVRAPRILRVTGCLDRYYKTSALVDPQYNVTTVVTSINGQLPIRSYTKNKMPSFSYASTYDCPTKGNVEIEVEGLNFGSLARVFIGDGECIVKNFRVSAEQGRLETITCTIPPGIAGPSLVRVQNGILPGIFQSTQSFSYRMAPPVPAAPVFTNVGARKIDITWYPPGNEFDNLMVTGYKIIWFQPKYRSRVSNITVGNITTTSIRGLEPATEYVFSIAAMSEGAFHEQSAILPTDLYGRRDPVSGAMIGEFSAYSNITGTTLYDFDFSLFDANKTLNHSGSTPYSSVGPTGAYGSEGSYGLVLVGSSNIQNCNVSSTCCDGFNATIGYASCGTYASVCAVLPARMLAYEYVIDGVTRRQVPSNLPYDNGGEPEIVVFTLDQLIANKGAELPTARCGPALRLTPAEARQSGASWYRRKVNVREGFDTYIRFELSNPSQRCDRLDDVNTYCRSRGADGFAFVIQNEGPTALGTAGKGLGYEGIFNSLAVELDTFHNYDQMDFYENHISVMTQVINI